MMVIDDQQIDPATVFIIDDDDSVRRSLSRLLSSANFQHESFSSAEAFLARQNYQGIGVIILDIRMHAMDGMHLQAALNKQKSNLPVIFLSGHADVATSVTAMRRGAANFFTKPVDDNTLLQAVHEAIDYHRVLNTNYTTKAVVQAGIETLTAREYEIMRYVISGVTNKRIASQLGIKEKTVKVHRAHVMEKLAANSIVDLVRSCDLLNIEPINIPD